MRFRVDPRDIPAEMAARRLGVTLHAFREKLDNLIARGFPQPDRDTGNFDLLAIDRWCDSRNAHLFGDVVMQARDASSVAAGQIAAMRGERS